MPTPAERTFLLPGGVPLVVVRIPPGTFVMGSPQSEVDVQWADTDEQQHTVTIAYEYYLGKFEFTQRQWLAVLGNNPSAYTPERPSGRIGITLDNPVESVTWNDVQALESALNALELGGVFRLPTEAEWEYGVRGGSQTRFHFGDSSCLPIDCPPCEVNDYEWWCGTHVAPMAHHPVGGKLPSPWGLYDTQGNIWEWCEDWYHNTYIGAPSDGSAWLEPPGTYRSIRGGTWFYPAFYCRPAFRFRAPPDAFRDYVGLRIAWTP